MAKESVPAHEAEIKENQLAFLNREPAAFSKNTYVVFPAQVLHGAHYKVNGNEGEAPSLYAVVFDGEKNELKTQIISRSQLTKQSFGINVASVNRVADRNGCMKGDVVANVSNISGVKPRWGYIINESGKRCWALPEPYAVKVGDASLHSFPILEQNGDKWEYRADEDDDTLCALERRNLPELLVQAPSSIKAVSLPTDWRKYSIKDKKVYFSRDEENA